MRSRLVDWWLHVQESYWFVPALMVLAALATSVATVHIDREVGDTWLRNLGWISVNQPAGARALLSTVAGSMITVAGVTFSMTLLAVSHATSQIGAHLLVSFMRDRGNQVTLGTFIATFLYCLIVLLTVRTGTEAGNSSLAGDFVPHIAIFVALLFAILSVAVLIYYIHHVPQSINVSNVVARVGNDLVRCVQSMYPERIGVDHTESGSNHVSPPRDFETNSRVIHVSSSAGYLRVVDDATLMSVASKHDLIVELMRRPGDFVVQGEALMRAWPHNRLTDEVEAALRGAFSWGKERTANQDVLLPTQQLLEVMGKALSPGVNDQFTAELCIDQLGRGLVAILRSEVPARHRLDEKGNLRVIAEPITQEAFICAVFSPMRQYVSGDRISTAHLLETLDRLQAIPDLGGSVALLAREAAKLRSAVLEAL